MAMTGQIAGPSIFSLELVGAIVALSMVVGAIDLIRQPGWAWKRAEESKAAYLILVLLLPLVGLGMYVFSARPKVAAIAAHGRAASLPFERFGDEAVTRQREEQRDDGWPIGTIAPPAGFESTAGETAGSATITEEQVRMVENVTSVVPPVPAPAMALATSAAGATTLSAQDLSTPSPSPAVPIAVRPTGEQPADAGISATFFSTGGGGRGGRGSMTMARTYRPRQRTSLTASEDVGAAATAVPTVPAGWKADPTGRHQFRYWDGFQWTENVADAGAQSMDAVSG
jgi:hypothetical protein